ncbi:MAG TPA: UvrD-helicase domain-containing protein, partial [Candidatus Acidoferrum sp.]|nr:UvrD-helicase domain-containing protein [Candidatus Acidoferrum sp.]
LLLRTRDLLRGHEGVRRAFTERFRYLLVDEFQDTDPIQAEILFYLAGEPPTPQADWRTWQLRPGALFVVGDPRQSIYRFRRADIDTYSLVKARVEAGGGAVLTLSANFRSVDAIGAFVDAAFQGVFPKEADPFQAAFVPLQTDRPGPQVHAGMARLVLSGNLKKKAEIAEADATQVSAFVAWALGGHVLIEEQSGSVRPARPSDVLILSLKKEFLEDIARALEARRIPYDLTGAEGFAEDPGVSAVFTLLQSLADPDNPLLVTAVLTGRLFGHSYQELYDFKTGGGRFAFLGGAPAAGEIAESLARMHALWRLTLDRSPAAALASILESLGIVPLAASSPLGAAAGGKLTKLVELIQAAPGTECADFPSAVEWLAGSVEGEVEPLSLLTGAREVVRVMNLHKAKGLEAAIVLLAAPWGNAEHEPTFHVDRATRGEAVGYFVVRQQAEYAGKVIALPPEWPAKAAREAQYLAAERDRLRYVAATRAKQLLVVSESPKDKENPWAALLPHIPAELSMAGIPLDASARPAVTIDPQGCVAALAERDRKLQAAVLPSLRHAAVTEVAKAAGPPPPRSEAGKGRAFGQVVHRCLEAAGRGIALTPTLLTSYLIEAERPPEEGEDVRNLVASILGSELWRRVLASPERHAEVPFAISLDGREIGAEAGPTLLQGTIDLVFRENSRWVLVDYKTDRIEGDLQPYVDYYAPQVRLYAQA